MNVDFEGWFFRVVMQRMFVVLYKHSLPNNPEERNPHLNGFLSAAYVIMYVVGNELVPR
jgi:hypothetical protein